MPSVFKLVLAYLAHFIFSICFFHIAWNVTVSQRASASLDPIITILASFTFSFNFNLETAVTQQLSMHRSVILILFGWDFCIVHKFLLLFNSFFVVIILFRCFAVSCFVLLLPPISYISAVDFKCFCNFQQKAFSAVFRRKLKSL